MKKIAITQRVQILSDINERRDALSQEWVSLANTCGFLPILLPNSLQTVQQILQEIQIDGLMFSGGNDLVAYGGDAPERDEVEHFLIDYAVFRRVPLLGVCRGMQILNVALGGTLCQHVNGHSSLEGQDDFHAVTALSDSFLAQLYGKHFTVNTAHHQAVEQLEAMTGGGER